MNKGTLIISKIIYRYENLVLLGVIFVNIFFIIIKRYVYIECLTICIIAIILLLRNRINFIDFYLKQIIIGILSVIITLGLACSFLYDTHNFLYLAKGYIECVVLESSEYTLLTVSAADDNDGRYSIHKSTRMLNRNNVRNFYERYMMKSNSSLDQDFKIIEKVVGEIKEYKYFSKDEYYLELQEGGGMFVVINKYSQFTIFKFEANT